MKTLFVALLMTFANITFAETLTTDEAEKNVVKEIEKSENSPEWRTEFVTNYGKCKVAVSKTDGYYSDNFQQLRKEIDNQIDERFDAFEIRKEIRTKQNSFTVTWSTLTSSEQEAIYANCVE